ncbi:MAG: shikimate dehydrogenase [Solirubrobacterales bacterium]|nr:shikimate dehydrogenase [Solirubrobacterales bacterium]
MKRLAVIGHPVAHSRSPAMQRAALAELGLEDWSYEAIDVEPAGFAGRVGDMQSEGFVGANVTIPHKEAALQAAGSASAAATEIGAANTLSFSEGEVRAANTDAPGLLEALPEPAAGKRALVLGAGGAARAVVWALAGQGARVELWNRTAERAEALAAEFGVSAQGGPAPTLAADHELLINTAAAGLDPDQDQLAALGLDPAGLTPAMTVLDLVYGVAETGLIAAARAAGATAVDGLELLVRQGAASLRIWTGLEPPLEVMREAARRPSSSA